MNPTDLAALRDLVRALPGMPLLTDDQIDALAQKALNALRSATGQWLTLVEGDEVTLDASGSWALLLPELPVRDVHSVIVRCGRRNTQGAEVELEEGVGYEWSAKGILRRCPLWPNRYRSVTVIYDHGYDPLPLDILNALADAIRSAAVERPGVDSVQLGSASYRFSKPGTTEQWAYVVRRYKVAA